ncbi:MAG: NAD(P)H-dependent oxidoreductase subunit E [Desulfobacteraceae bacterium]|nr:MAG: NAD(P)H-dependent oxidoreductase subunit E [Desulfobacteraceae bacterium]
MNASDTTAPAGPQWAELDGVLDEWRGQRGAIIPVLQRAQKIFGYLPPEVMRRVAAGLRAPLSRVFGVATFYSQFYLTRRGRHVVRQCDGTACHVRGAGKIVERMEQELGIAAGATTPDYRVTYEVVYCVGSCGLAPVAVVDEQSIGKLSPERMKAILKSLE